ncbi:MAG: hypothetical protein WCV85_01960 [Patescibacteria group bacterium]|jgi:hypothetical protein
MSLQKYLLFFCLATLFSWLAWLIVLTQLNPDVNRSITVMAFSLSLGFAVAGTVTLFGFGVRAWFGKNVVLFRALQTSVRQGVIVAVFVEALLVLQAMRWFAWWNAVPLTLFFILLEAFFLAQENAGERQTR